MKEKRIKEIIKPSIIKSRVISIVINNLDDNTTDIKMESSDVNTAELIGILQIQLQNLLKRVS